MTWMNGFKDDREENSPLVCLFPTTLPGHLEIVAIKKAPGRQTFQYNSFLECKNSSIIIGEPVHISKPVFPSHLFLN